MAKECRHIMPSGSRCHAIALRGTDFCYFHSNLNRVEKAKQNCLALPLAPIEDLRGIQLALTQIIGLIDNPYSDNKRVGQLLYALQIATQLASRIEACQPKPSACPHCGEVIAATSEPPELASTGSNGLLPTEIATPSDAGLIEDHAPQSRLRAALPVLLTTDR